MLNQEFKILSLLLLLAAVLLPLLAIGLLHVLGLLGFRLRLGV